MQNSKVLVESEVSYLKENSKPVTDLLVYIYNRLAARPYSGSECSICYRTMIDLYSGGSGGIA